MATAAEARRTAFGALWAIETKRSLDPRPSRGFHEACEDLQPAERIVVYPGDEAFPVAANVRAMPVMGVVRRVMGAG